MQDDMSMIPCEFCFAHIHLNVYSDHIRRYHSQVTLPITGFLTDVNSDDIEDDDDLDMQRYVTSSHQVDGNLRSFLQTHFSRAPPTHTNSPRGTPGSSPPQSTPILFQMPRGFNLMEDVPKSGIANINSISTTLSEDFIIEDGEICVICQDDLTKPLRKLTCCHIYCEKCIIMWMKRHTKCPVCQYDFVE